MTPSFASKAKEQRATALPWQQRSHAKAYGTEFPKAPKTYPGPKPHSEQCRFGLWLLQ
jgi:hypothetical protein